MDEQLVQVHAAWLVLGGRVVEHHHHSGTVQCAQPTRLKQRRHHRLRGRHGGITLRRLPGRCVNLCLQSGHLRVGRVHPLFGRHHQIAQVGEAGWAQIGAARVVRAGRENESGE